MVDGDLRLLIVDGCQLNAWLAGHLVPDGVRVELAQSFDRARATLSDDPPHAAIFNVTPCDLPWEELALLCQDHDPPIPFIWCSAVFDSPEQAGTGPIPGAGFCYKPSSVEEMRQQIVELMGKARANTEPAQPARKAQPPLPSQA